MNQDIRQQIITLFNLGSLPAEEQEKMILQIGELVFEASLARIMENMTDAEQQELENSLTPDTTPEELLKVIMDKEPRFMEIVGEELQKLKEHADKVMG